MAYKDKDKQKAYQRQWVRQKRSSTGSTLVKGSTYTQMVQKIATVKPSDGTDQDNIRAASDRLVACLGPAIEPTVKQQSYNPMMVGYVPPQT